MTEPQRRIVLQTLRQETEDRGGPEDHSYRLGGLVERNAKVVGLDVAYIKSTVESVVDGQEPD